VDTRLAVLDNWGIPADESGKKELFFGRLQQLVAWAEKFHLAFWLWSFLLFLEMATSLTSKYDIARFGGVMRIRRAKRPDGHRGNDFHGRWPRHPPAVEQMMEPAGYLRWSCSNSGGMYDIYSVVKV